LLLIENIVGREKGIEYLEKVVLQEDNKKAIAFVRYFLGRYYEINQKNDNKASEYYSDINKADLNNYRAKFKIGCKEFREKVNKDGQSTFTSIISNMEKKLNSGWIKPLELEYYYKCCLLCEKIEKNMTKGDEMKWKNKIEQIKNELFPNSEFVKQFWSKSEVSKYTEYFRMKLEGYQI